MIHCYGCSFTKYNWPTYADILAADFNVSNNGASGSGNEQIFAKILFDFRKGNLNKESVVICQWSGFNRFQYLLKNQTWIGDGNIFLPQNQKLYKKIKSFYNLDYELEKTINYVIAVTHLLENSVRKFVFLSMDKLLLDIGIDTEFDNLQSKYKGYYSFTKNCNWFDSKFYTYNDYHPTVLQHLDLSEKISNQIDISLTNRTKAKCKELENKILEEKNFISYDLH